MSDPERNQDKTAEEVIVVNSAIPKNREELVKWNGWGYKDSKFVVEGEEVYFSGKRYSIGGSRLPHFPKWVLETLNIDPNIKMIELPPPSEDSYTKPNITSDVFNKIVSLGISYSTKVIDRIIRAHGHTLHDMYILKYSSFQRIPDIVLFPNCHSDVEKIVELANNENLVILIFGGGTAVSGAVECPKNETRTIISLDTSQMNRILWLDKENLVACCESGIIGQDLERELTKLGFTTGHEPDSNEFSSLGGWVATRASGMKKNVYGNIEDLVIQIRMVTPKGVLEKNCRVPRISCGPDFNHVVLGSEGSLGVITEVTIKIRPLPQCRKYGSIVFPNFEAGVNCMREIAKKRCQPASIRLLDNQQFQLGQLLRPDSGFYGLILDGLAKFFITVVKRFDMNQICVMTLLFEGEVDDVKINEKKIIDIAKNFGGFSAGQSNGERGYTLTFVIAYLRDFALEYRVVADSFETSVPWNKAVSLVRNVKEIVEKECQQLGITYFLINSRVTQTYDAGCVIYFYLAFNFNGIDNPVELHNVLEMKARDTIIACGGSISHHHGVGKIRKKWYPMTVSSVGVDLYLATKRELDPKNIFATNNLVESKL